jgi:glucose-6-phosphate isomerase
MLFDSGLDLTAINHPLGFSYGKGHFGPTGENRKLNNIRQSLLNPDCEGPETVYAIAMDVGKLEHLQLLQQKMLLFGVVAYATGRLGEEPIKSQGHIHKVSKHSGWSPPEIYQIWNGSAVIYMQEFVEDHPGRCFAVLADLGDIVIVPPNWAHSTISADPFQQLIFGAWCDREYGFLYDKIKERKGLAWYPVLDENNQLQWKINPHYKTSELIIKKPEDYFENFGIEKSISIYSQFQKNPLLFEFISKPVLKQMIWKNFVP